MTAGMTSTADAAHGSLRLDKIGFADMMAGLLPPDDRTEKIAKGIIRRAAPDQAAQIMLHNAKETGADFPVRRQTESIAVSTKRFADRGDDAYFAAPAGQSPASGCFGRVE